MCMGTAYIVCGILSAGDNPHKFQSFKPRLVLFFLHCWNSLSLSLSTTIHSTNVSFMFPSFCSLFLALIVVSFFTSLHSVHVDSRHQDDASRRLNRKNISYLLFIQLIEEKNTKFTL